MSDIVFPISPLFPILLIASITIWLRSLGGVVYKRTSQAWQRLLIFRQDKTIFPYFVSPQGMVEYLRRVNSKQWSQVAIFTWFNSFSVPFIIGVIAFAAIRFENREVERFIAQGGFSAGGPASGHMLGEDMQVTQLVEQYAASQLALEEIRTLGVSTDRIEAAVAIAYNKLGYVGARARVGYSNIPFSCRHHNSPAACISANASFAGAAFRSDVIRQELVIQPKDADVYMVEIVGKAALYSTVTSSILRFVGQRGWTIRLAEADRQADAENVFLADGTSIGRVSGRLSFTKSPVRSTNDGLAIIPLSPGQSEDVIEGISRSDLVEAIISRRGVVTMLVPVSCGSMRAPSLPDQTDSNNAGLWPLTAGQAQPTCEVTDDALIVLERNRERELGPVPIGGLALHMSTRPSFFFRESEWTEVARRFLAARLEFTEEVGVEVKSEEVRGVVDLWYLAPIAVLVMIMISPLLAVIRVCLYFNNHPSVPHLYLPWEGFEILAFYAEALLGRSEYNRRPRQGFYSVPLGLEWNELERKYKLKPTLDPQMFVSRNDRLVQIAVPTTLGSPMRTPAAVEVVQTNVHHDEDSIQSVPLSHSETGQGSGVEESDQVEESLQEVSDGGLGSRESREGENWSVDFENE